MQNEKKNRNSNMDYRDTTEYSQKLHENAQQVSTEIHKLLISLSTGVISVFFLTLTGTKHVKMAVISKLLITGSLLLMGISIACGLFYLRLRASIFYYRGTARVANTAEKKKRFSKLYQQKQKQKKIVAQLFHYLG